MSSFVPSCRTGITWLQHQHLADVYRTHELHRIASQLVSDNIHSRSFGCQFRGRSLRLNKDFEQEIINGHYRIFSRRVFDWKNVLGVAPFVPVMLPDGNIVPMALDFDTCEIGIYHDVTSAQNCYVVRFSQRFYAMMQHQGQIPLFDRRSLDFAYGRSSSSTFDVESVLHQDTRELVAHRLDIRSDNFLGTDSMDYGVFVIEGFNRNPTLSGIITSVVACAQHKIDQVEILRGMHMRYIDKIVAFQPFNEVDGVGETKQMREFYQKVALTHAGSDAVSDFLKRTFHEATSEKHQIDAVLGHDLNQGGGSGDPLVSGTGGVSALAQGTGAGPNENPYITLARRLLVAQNYGYNAVVGGKISSYRPPDVDFGFIQLEALELRKTICNLYGIPIGIIDPLTSQQGNVQMQEAQFKITINSENQMLENALNLVFGVLELDRNADTFLAIKFNEMIRPEAIRKLCKEKRRPRAWEFLEASDSARSKKSSVERILKELMVLKVEHGDIEYKLELGSKGRGTQPHWVLAEPMPFMEDFDNESESDLSEAEDPVVRRKKSKRPDSALRIERTGSRRDPAKPLYTENKRFVDVYDRTDEDNELAEQSNGDRKRLIFPEDSRLGKYLGKIPYLTAQEVDDVYMYMIVQLKNSEVAEVFERILDPEADRWMKTEIRRAEMNGQNDARQIRLVYHIYGTCTIAEMITLFSLGAVTPKELRSQLRYRMNLENEPDDHSLDIALLEKLQKQIATEAILASLRTTGVPVIGNLLMAGHAEKVAADKEKKKPKPNASTAKKKPTASDDKPAAKATEPEPKTESSTNKKRKREAAAKQKHDESDGTPKRRKVAEGAAEKKKNTDAKAKTK